MRKGSILLLFVAAACGPATNTTSTTSIGAVSPLAIQPPPIYSLFGYRAELGLSSEQVEALDSIARDVRMRNDPVVDSLRVRTDRRGLIRVNDETRPMLQQVGANNRAAASGVEALLTEAQRERVCTLRQTDEERERRGERRERRPVALEPADSALFAPLAGGWPWCGNPIF